MIICEPISEICTREDCSLDTIKSEGPISWVFWEIDPEMALGVQEPMKNKNVEEESELEKPSGHNAYNGHFKGCQYSPPSLILELVLSNRS